MQTYSNAELTEYMRKCIVPTETGAEMRIYVLDKGRSEGTDRLRIMLPLTEAAVANGLRWAGQPGRQLMRRLPSDIDHIAIYPFKERVGPHGSSRICISYPTFKELFMSLLNERPLSPAAPAAPTPAPVAPNYGQSSVAFDYEAHVKRAEESLAAARQMAEQEKERQARAAAEAEKQKARAAVLADLAEDAQLLQTLQLLVQDLSQGEVVFPLRTQYVKFWEQQQLHDWAAFYGYEIVRVGDGTTATLKKKGI